MSIDVTDLALELIRRFNRLIEDIDIPINVFREVGLSGFEVQLCRDGGADYKNQLLSAEKNFERLCRSTFAPADAVKAISLGYAAMAYMCDPKREFPDDDDAIETILAAQFSYGVAQGILFGTATILSDRKKGLSKAGQRGADSRNKQYEALKQWALKKASEMRGADRDIARTLAAQIPIHLADKSKDPMRLIYDALRTNIKS